MTDPNRPVTGYPAQNPNGGYPTPQPYGTAVAPAYYNNNNPHYYNNNPQNYYPDPAVAQRAAFVRRFLRIMIVSVIITGTIIFIIWLILRPRFPEFQVNSLSVSNLNLSSSRSAFTGVFDVNFTVRNPNKKITLVYESITADIYYRTNYLTESALQPFRQPKKNVTAIRGVFSALATYLTSDALGEINKDMGNGGHVPFNVRIVMTVGFNAGAWKLRERIVRVFCGDLSVEIHSNASNMTMIGGPQLCKVGI